MYIIVTSLIASLAFAGNSDSRPCETLLTRVQTFVAEADVTSLDAWLTHRPRMRPVVDAFVRDGYRASFVERQLAALTFARDHTNLRIFDLYGAELREFLDPVRDAEVLARIRDDRKILGGLFFTTKRRGEAVFVIAVDRTSRVLPVTDALIEEILHFRMATVQSRLFPDEVDPVSPERDLPFILTRAGAPLAHLLDEFAAKEALEVHGKGRPRDREGLLLDLRIEAERRPGQGVVGYAHLCLLIAVAARKHGTDWRAVPLADVLKLAFVAEPPELLASFRTVDDAVVDDLFRTLLSNSFTRPTP